MGFSFINSIHVLTQPEMGYLLYRRPCPGHWSPKVNLMPSLGPLEGYYFIFFSLRLAIIVLVCTCTFVTSSFRILLSLQELVLGFYNQAEEFPNFIYFLLLPAWVYTGPPTKDFICKCSILRKGCL